MGHATTERKAKVRFLSGVLDHISDAQLETLDILTDVDQMTDLMSSLLEVRTGQIVSLKNAFGDL